MAGTKQAAEINSIGLSLLKGLMSFEIIVAFLWEVNVKTTGALGWVYYLRNMAIPVFVMILFLTFAGRLKSKNGSGFWRKLLELFVPLVTWGIIYWVFFYFLKDMLSDEDNMYDITVRDLFYQIITGNSPYLNPVMWLIVNEILLLVLFELIILISAKFHNVIFIVLMAAALACQYMGINYLSGVRSEIRGCVMMLQEMLPFAVVGFLLAVYGTVEKTKKWWPVTMLLSAGVICFLRYYGIFTDITGNGYAGVKRIVLAAALVLLFAAPPLDKLPEFLHKAVNWLTRFSLGIFCMHRLVSTLLHYLISHRGWVDMETYTLFDCVLTFVICYVISLLIWLIPCKFTKMLVEG